MLPVLFLVMQKYTFFDIKDYLNLNQRLQRWLNPFKLLRECNLNSHAFRIEATGRAIKQLDKTNNDLLVEMQLLFSCVVKKRVVFHHESRPNYSRVDDKIAVCFRMVQPTNCDPQEFAEHFPEKCQLEPASLKNLYPHVLRLDYVAGQWLGDFDLSGKK